MQQVPLLSASDMKMESSDSRNMIVLEVGLPGDTWRYCVERQQLTRRSEWFRAMLLGPLAPAFTDPPPIVKLPHIEKRAFDNFFSYLRDEPISFNSVSTARATLDVAHQYLCPDLAHMAVNFLQDNLKPSNVLEVYHGLMFYINDTTLDAGRTPTTPTAPPAPGDDAGEIADACNRLLHYCLVVIDSEAEAIFCQESFEDLLHQEVASLTCRDGLRLQQESVLFSSLDRWAASECRRKGEEPTPANKRAVLSDDVWYNVRYLLMTDKEFIQGPMASGILSTEESAYIVSRILGHDQSQQKRSILDTADGPVSKLTEVPRINSIVRKNFYSESIKSGKKEQEDNRRNRRKECAIQGQRACARIGNCLVRVLACVFD